MSALSQYTAVIISLLLSVKAFAMDFTPRDESQTLEPELSTEDESPIDKDSVVSEGLEADQPEIRVTRSRAVALRLGEALPHTSLGVSYQSFVTDSRAFSLTLAKGEYRFAEQGDGEAWVENKAKTWLLGARYLWWPNSYFPFSVPATFSIENVNGTLSSRTGTRGDYRAQSIYVSTGLVMSHIFNSGLLLEWTLLSVNYGKVIAAKYNDATGHQMEMVRKNLNGFSVLGFANLAFGYAW